MGQVREIIDVGSCALGEKSPGRGRPGDSNPIDIVQDSPTWGRTPQPGKCELDYNSSSPCERAYSPLSVQPPCQLSFSFKERASG